jgi:hypothetical protein
MGHSLTTQKRRMVFNHVTQTVPQHVTLGVVQGKDVPSAKAIFERMQFYCHFVLLPNGRFEIQRDRPNKILYKKNCKNWYIDEVNPKLWTNGTGPVDRVCKLTDGIRQVVRLTEHDLTPFPGEISPKKMLLVTNIVTLEAFPEQLEDPDIQELEDVGVKIVNTKWVKKGRNSRRGSFQKTKRRRPGTNLLASLDLNIEERTKMNWRTLKRKRTSTHFKPQEVELTWGQVNQKVRQNIEIGGWLDPLSWD